MAKIGDVVNAKDAFTRMHQERRERLAASRAAAANVAQRRAALQDMHHRLGRLFSETNPQKRGTELEKLLNGLFALVLVICSDELKGIGDAIASDPDGRTPEGRDVDEIAVWLCSAQARQRIVAVSTSAWVCRMSSGS